MLTKIQYRCSDENAHETRENNMSVTTLCKIYKQQRDRGDQRYGEFVSPSNVEYVVEEPKKRS